MESTVAALIVIAIGLVPPYLAVRQMVRPREEPDVSRARALLGPLAVGLGVGWAAGEIVTGLQDSDCGNTTWGCFDAYLLVTFIGGPLTMLIGCVALRLAGTASPWLTGLFGLPMGIYFLSHLSTLAVGEPGVVAFILAFLGGYVVSALAIGFLLPPVGRLAVYAAAIAVTPIAGALSAST